MAVVWHPVPAAGGQQIEKVPDRPDLVNTAMLTVREVSALRIGVSHLFAVSGEHTERGNLATARSLSANISRERGVVGRHDAKLVPPRLRAYARSLLICTVAMTAVREA